MGHDYYAEGKDGELTITVRVDEDGVRGQYETMSIDVPEGAKVYVEAGMEGGVKER